MTILDLILEAAKKHGEAGEPGMEVGDLQQLARDLWSCLSTKQQKAFYVSSLNLIDWPEFVDQWLPEESRG